MHLCIPSRKSGCSKFIQDVFLFWSHVGFSYDVCIIYFLIRSIVFLNKFYGFFSSAHEACDTGAATSEAHLAANGDAWVRSVNEGTAEKAALTLICVKSRVRVPGSGCALMASRIPEKTGQRPRPQSTLNPGNSSRDRYLHWGGVDWSYRRNLWVVSGHNNAVPLHLSTDWKCP